MRYYWQLSTPLNGIVFDCDGTLSHIEGIDELARNSNYYAEICAMTLHAMSHAGLTEEIYTKRLQLIKPSRAQILDLTNLYINHVTPYAKNVIDIFKSLGKEIYILSSGITAAVTPFGNYLGIKNENIYAVNVSFNEDGTYHHFDQDNPLIRAGGKIHFIKHILAKSSRLALIGDGVSDSEAAQQVTRFIGYGGAAIKQKVADLSTYYLMYPSLLPLLPLCLTIEETKLLNGSAKEYYEKGILLIEQGAVIIRKE
jgi:phosphoserine phosphatase